MWYWSDPTVLFSNALYLFDGTGQGVPIPPVEVPLPIPANFTAVVNGTVSVTLAWTPINIVTLAGYQIWRDRVLIATVSTPTYTDTTVKADRHYSYAVNAVDLFSQVGPQTIPLTVDVLTSAHLTFEISFQEQPGEGGFPDVAWKWQ